MPDVTIEVDRDTCIGNGMCRAAAPDSFGSDDDGLVVALDPAATPLDALLDAAASCPVNAIALRDVETGELLELPF